MYLPDEIVRHILAFVPPHPCAQALRTWVLMRSYDYVAMLPRDSQNEFIMDEVCNYRQNEMKTKCERCGVFVPGWEISDEEDEHCDHESVST